MGNKACNRKLGIRKGIIKVEDKKEGWEKSSIDYYLDNKSMLIGYIKSLGVSSTDSDMIYSDLAMYLYKAYDYRIVIKRNHVITMKEYIKVCAKFCVKRYFTQLGKHKEVSESREGYSLYDMVGGEEDLNLMEIDRHVIEAEEINQNRYTKVDCLAIWYLMLLLNSMGKDTRIVLGLVGDEEMRKIKNYSLYCDAQVAKDNLYAKQVESIEKLAEKIAC